MVDGPNWIVVRYRLVMDWSGSFYEARMKGILCLSQVQNRYAYPSFIE